MTETATARPRRVTVVAPHTRVDLALPAQATVGEVVAQLVELIGAHATAASPGATGWTLGLLGRAPLEPGRSVASTGISDGDLLHLLPREDAPPAAVFDDVVDAIAAASTSRPDRWGAVATRRASLSAAFVVLVAGAWALAGAGPSDPRAGQAVAAGIALLLLGAATAFSRAIGDAAAGAVVGAAALPYAYWAAAGGYPGGPLTAPTAEALMVGCAAVILAAVAGAAAVGRHRAVFAAAGGVALTGAVGGLVCALGAGAPRAAAVVSGLAMASVPWLPYLSVRAARMPLPVVPIDTAEFRRDERPTEGAAMIGLARRGDLVFTWILVTLATVVLASSVVLVRAGGRWELVLAAVLCGALVLRARRFPGLPHRIVLMVPGSLGLLLLLTEVLPDAGPGVRAAVAPLAVVLATGLLAVAMRSRRRGAAPYVGRLVDLLDFLVLASVLPLVGAVLGAYARIRGLGG